MDPLDPRYHPSTMPLHDAAYPDSSYRPPDPVQERLPEEKNAASLRRLAGGQISYPDLPNAAASGSRGPVATSSQDYGVPPYPSSVLPARYPTGPVSPLSPTSPSPTFPRPAKQPIPWTPDSFMAIHPNLPPPPPYNPSRPGTGNSIVGADPPSPTTSFSSRAPLHPVTIQLDDGFPRPHIQRSTTRRGNGSVSAPNAGASGELGPVELARRRRKKRVRIIVCGCIVFLLFLVALTVGIAIGAIRANLNQRRPPPPPPFQPPSSSSPPRATYSASFAASTTAAHF